MSRNRVPELCGSSNADSATRMLGPMVAAGPNGGGKTTFIRAVATLLWPDSGELRVAGFNAATEPRRVRQVRAWPASTRRSSRR